MTSSPILIGCMIALATLVAMEGVAYLLHRFVMHGALGWSIHRSHHRERSGFWEANDLYGIFFAVLSFASILFSTYRDPLFWVGIGMALYGLCYALLHDGLVHRRFRFVPMPRHGYLLRLVRAHRIHHAVKERDGAVSFGFLYAPPVAALVERVRRSRRP